MIDLFQMIGSMVPSSVKPTSLIVKNTYRKGKLHAYLMHHIHTKHRAEKIPGTGIEGQIFVQILGREREQSS